MEIPENTAFGKEDYFARVEALQRRVADAAQELNDRGIRPTVARIRAALGGGSPNDLAPALKSWKESFRPTTTYPGDLRTEAQRTIPIQIADLAHELWQRASIAAVAERKGGSAARTLAMRTEEAQLLRQQNTSLRDQLERESMALGELRVQAARHEAIARDALARLEESQARERRQLRELGSAREQTAELEATVAQLRMRTAATSPSRRRPSPPAKKARSSKLVRHRQKKSSRAADAVRKKSTATARGAATTRRGSRRRAR